MNNSDWFLIVVIAVAFIAGYSIVSFIVKKMKSQQDSVAHVGSQPGQSQQEKTKFEDKTDDSAHSESNHGVDWKDQRWAEEISRQRSETCESQNEEQRHAHVLELRGKITATDVKRSYRELLSKYHPDKVNHLGDEFKSIAEAKTRKILEAYDYFRKKYDI